VVVVVVVTCADEKEEEDELLGRVGLREEGLSKNKVGRVENEVMEIGRERCHSAPKKVNTAARGQA
jgi:hypothetical protein